MVCDGLGGGEEERGDDRFTKAAPLVCSIVAVGAMTVLAAVIVVGRTSKASAPH